MTAFQGRAWGCGGRAGDGMLRPRAGVALLCLFALTLAQPGGPRKFFLSDEGLAKIHYIDLDNPDNNWTTESPTGSIRDLQLVGNNRVMLGVGDGYAEFDVTTGDLLDHTSVYDGVGAVRRLPNGNTVVGKKDNNALMVVDPEGNRIDTIQLERPMHRLLRVTSEGNFVYGNGADVVEADTTGAVVWSASVTDAGADEVYAAIRQSSNCVWVTTAYDNSLLRIDNEGNITKLVAGEEHGSFEFAGFQILPGGKIVVANWQGHGSGHGDQAHQVMQFDTAAKAVDWYWEQDPELISSINNVLVVDGLDPQYLHTDGEGPMKPVGDDTGLRVRQAEAAGAVSVRAGARCPGVLVGLSSPLCAGALFSLRGELIRVQPSENAAGAYIRLGGTDSDQLGGPSEERQWRDRLR